MEGRVTQHREHVTPQPTRYKVGNDYPIQPAGKEAICRVRVLHVREERVGQATHQDAKAMGYRNTATFKAAWVQQHDKQWAGKTDPSEMMLLERFAARHANRLVTVVVFELAVDIPRFLASPGPNQGDYTEQRHRAIDDLECIDRATQARFSKQAEEFWVERFVERAERVESDKARRKAERGRSMRLPPTHRKRAA